MKRYIIVNEQTGVYAGIYYSEAWALECLPLLSEDWPGLDWNVQETDCGFPVPGLKHIGEHGMKKHLARLCQ